MTFPLPLMINGVGRYLPERVVSSAGLEKRCNLPRGWVENKQGVSERRWASGEETASFMGAKALLEALNSAGLEPHKLDLILNASGTQEQAIPDGAPLIQRHLGLGDSGVACLSLHTTCLSFLNGLDVASNLLATGRYKTIGIVSSEIASVGLDFTNPEVCTLFGDGAAAAVVTRTPPGEASALEAARFETYGSGAFLTQIPGGGTRCPPNGAATQHHDNVFQMNGKAVYRLVLQHVPGFLERLRPGLSRGLGDIGLVVPHQASKRALKAHARFGMPEGKVIDILQRFGNCVAASLPMALYEAVEGNRITRGEKILLLGTGAGLSIGGLVLRY